MIPIQYDILKAIITKLNGLGLTSYLSQAPEKTSYPFITLSFAASTNFNYDFDKNIYEENILKFSVFNDNPQYINILDIAENIEDLMENIKEPYLNCVFFHRAIGPRYVKYNRYEYILEYRIISNKSYQ
jgi:hypothetical protein